uniref:ORF3b protein n=1 Tax=Canine coronavirus TaxID=11153 RepID=A0A8E6CQ35_9ALPC|nr:ORF3b protein [Canine coronavirus]QWY12684.1 ORF3b protein [Canine coronavirus]
MLSLVSPLLKKSIVIQLFNITVYKFQAKFWYKLPFETRLCIIKNTKPKALSVTKHVKRDYRKTAILNSMRK